MAKSIPGFIYTRQGAAVAYTAAAWREQAARLTDGGGFVRCEFGETFIHGPDGRIAAEIYGQGQVKARPKFN